MHHTRLSLRPLVSPPQSLVLLLPLMSSSAQNNWFSSSVNLSLHTRSLVSLKTSAEILYVMPWSVSVWNFARSMGPLAAVIRTDPAPGFASLQDDAQLTRFHLSIEVGHAKKTNKNPVAEKAIRELEDEILRHEPSGGPLTSLTLSLATARLNSRLRSRGLSAREMWTQRDQFTHNQIPLSDADLISTQHEQRLSNHPHSERSKAPSRVLPNDDPLAVGDLVYLRSDRTKSSARPRYLVTSVDGSWCNIRKFIGSQLRKSSYRVKTSQCMRVPVPLLAPPPHQMSDEDETDLGFLQTPAKTFHQNSRCLLARMSRVAPSMNPLTRPPFPLCPRAPPPPLMLTTVRVVPLPPSPPLGALSAHDALHLNMMILWCISSVVYCIAIMCALPVVLFNNSTHSSV